LTFGRTWRCNPSLHGLMLPPSLTQLSLPGGCNQPRLADVALPSSLTSLTVGQMFNRSLADVRLPAELRALSFTEYGQFNQFVGSAHLHLPSTLTSLIFGRRFNQPVNELHLPSSLTHLEFGEQFRQRVDQLRLPDSLRHLQFGSHFSDSLAAVSLPASLTTFVMCDRFHHGWYAVPPLRRGMCASSCFDGWKPPSSLTDLRLVLREFRHDEFQMPTALRRLTIDTWHFTSLASLVHQLPKSLTELQLEGNYFESGAYPESEAGATIVWPPELRILTLGDGFSLPLHDMHFPSSLTSLTLGAEFNQSLSCLGSLTSTLTHLRIDSEYARPTVNWHPPTSITELEFGEQWNHAAVVRLHPLTRLRRLSFHGPIPSLNDAHLPATLHELHFTHPSFDAPLNSVDLPPDLRVLVIRSVDFRQPFAGLPNDLPASLRRIEISRGRRAQLEHWRRLSLPLGCCLVTMPSGASQGDVCSRGRYGCTQTAAQAASSTAPCQSQLNAVIEVDRVDGSRCRGCGYRPHDRPSRC
jgi:hypothetical protein